ncbi:MAG: YraN family protein [Lachnospiraceae bacterium]|nr:YraN family protein [Lachnospiraceae bacterium]
MHTNSRDVGKLFENKAEAYLKSKDYVILDKNFHCRYGEIDLIAISPDQTIVFVEVKSRHSCSYGSAVEAVTAHKCEKIRKTSRFYIYQKKLGWNRKYRYDVIVFQNEHMNHIMNAFY